MPSTFVSVYIVEGLFGWCVVLKGKILNWKSVAWKITSDLIQKNKRLFNTPRSVNFKQHYPNLFQLFKCPLIPYRSVIPKQPSFLLHTHIVIMSSLHPANINNTILIPLKTFSFCSPLIVGKLPAIFILMFMPEI